MILGVFLFSSKAYDSIDQSVLCLYSVHVKLYFPYFIHSCGGYSQSLENIKLSVHELRLSS